MVRILALNNLYLQSSCVISSLEQKYMYIPKHSVCHMETCRVPHCTAVPDGRWQAGLDRGRMAERANLSGAHVGRRKGGGRGENRFSSV